MSVRYRDCDNIIKIAKEIAADLASQLDSEKKLDADKIEKSEYDYPYSFYNKINDIYIDYKFLVTQRDAEIHTLKQNFELQFQETLILKQKLIETVDAYETLSNSLNASEKYRKGEVSLIIFFYKLFKIYF